MTIYQVVNEQNHLVREYMDLDTAVHGAEEMTVWDTDHYYHVETLELQVN